MLERRELLVREGEPGGRGDLPAAQVVGLEAVRVAKRQLSDVVGSALIYPGAACERTPVVTLGTPHAWVIEVDVHLGVRAA
ncbi:MAG TPA: hypothetical protein VFZ00_20100 [Solirubrobacter sp.]|nr:hypothetical protein [Solirubrobacter sp.]